MRFHTPETVKNFNRVYLDVIFENPLLLKLVKARIVSPSMLAQSIAFFDGLAMVLTGLIAKELYVGNDFTGDNDQWGGYYVTIGIAVSLFLLIASHHGEYNVKKLNSLTWQLGSVLSISVAAFALTFAVLFFLKVSAQFSRVWFATWSVSSVASLFLAQI